MSVPCHLRCFNDDSELVGLRYANWKFVFQEQRVTGTLRIWG